MGRDRIDQVAVDRARRSWHPGQRTVPGVGRADHASTACSRTRPAARGVAADVVREEALAKTSLHRLVSADDIAHAILFLASPLGANISGHALPVDADTQALV